MTPLIKFTLKLIAFWLLYFLAQRCLFIWLGIDAQRAVTAGEFMLSHRYGLALDLSMIGYILALPALYIIGALFLSKSKEIKPVYLRWYFLVMIFLSSLIFIADLGLYAEWGSKLNRKAMAYAEDPSKVMISAQSTPLLLLTSVLVLSVLIGHWLLKRLFARPISINSKLIPQVLYSLMLIAGILIAIRGGLQPLPIKKNWSYFSKNNLLNLAAVNSTWNCMELLVSKDKLKKNPYQYFSQEKADALFDEMHPLQNGARESIIKSQRPNVLMILLESWSADVIEATGGQEGVTPGFSKLAKEGLLFPNYYATGFRTEQGQAALFGGFPAQPTTTVMSDFEKFSKLPGLASNLNDEGYSSSFYYTGDLDFANTGKYLFSAGFQQIIGEQSTDFDQRTLWGAMDEELFNYHLAHVSDDAQPFFSVLMTSTSHEPFEAPVEKIFEGDDPAILYRNTVHYTDDAMYDYLQAAKQTDWYDNTLIFILADHAHHLPHRRERHDPERHHIPMLITGGALKPEYRGTSNESYTSHADFATTLLNQLDISSSDFKYSNDIFSPSYPEYAFYTFEDGFGWVDSTGALVYDQQLGSVISQSEGMDPEALDNGKAYLQVLMQDYIDF